MKKIYKILSNKKGDVLGFIITAVVVVYCILYLILGSAFLLKINDASNIANKKLDRALVAGQFTDQLMSELITELEEEGFKGSELEISVTPSESNDGNDATYSPRGTEIELKILYKRPHWFYHVNKLAPGDIDEKLFYIGTKVSGMSELW